ncbi:cold shock domain-containing protein [Pseudomonas fluorescens]|uniref:Uncharacterized protein n=1 Tax=Pseudomonas fluorescens TaxID=294 RepID=A0A5E7UWX6_PSEFL|nr:cold shock domain-containing protein [Pseudomonas fluorescens]VVQ16092.1 hypothetical protein PS928_04337 [Pseudomonas fluorescens]
MLQGGERSFGAVKWFGGHNKQTQKENNYGFLQDASGQDIFLKKNDWQSTPLPLEGEVVTYIVEEKNEKHSARQACRLTDSKLNCVEIYKAICALSDTAQAVGRIDIRNKLCEYLCQIFCSSTQEEIKVIAKDEKQIIYSIIKQHPKSIENYAFLIEASEAKITENPLWANLPSSLIKLREDEIAKQFSDLEPSIVRKKSDIHLSFLPPSLIVYLLVKQVYTTPQQLGHDCDRVYNYIKLVTIDNSETFPDYLQLLYEEDLSLHKGKPSNPLLLNILDFLYFKRSLHEKNTDFIEIYTQSTRLSRNIETFILYNLFSLIISGNNRDVAYDIFLQRLWMAITSKSIMLEQQPSKIEKLFPSCITLGRKLSCEAVYWAKNEIYLCRGRPCHNPQVVPKPSRDYFEFNIYDWLAHYGINYFTEAKPESKDFPIKLAGYFNRLREIYKVIHCQACRRLMLPNMKYARTEYKDFENGIPVVKSMAAAYRLTVFHCNNESCCELDKGYYISHCIGYGCHQIIDTRNLKTQCGTGKYICRGCGSCCGVHAKSDPAGLCADCGSPLKILQKTVKGYSVNFAKCSSSNCEFTIESGNLPAKLKHPASTWQ